MKEAKASDEVERKKAEKETVRWVLGTPARLEKLVADGSREEAEKDWEEVRELLKKWEGVKGVQELRDACEKVMEKSDEAS